MVVPVVGGTVAVAIVLAQPNVVRPVKDCVSAEQMPETVVTMQGIVPAADPVRKILQFQPRQEYNEQYFFF